MANRYLWALFLTSVVLVACGKKDESPTAAVVPAVVASAPAVVLKGVEEKVLNIYNWPDYVPEGLIAAFEKESGIKVNYDTFETNEALQAKLVAGNTGYDIVVPGTVFSKTQIESGLLQPLDKSRIPHLANLDRHDGESRPRQQASRPLGLGLHHGWHQPDQSGEGAGWPALAGQRLGSGV